MSVRVPNPSYVSGICSQLLLYWTVGDVLACAARDGPDNTALVVRHQGVRPTYRELDEQVRTGPAHRGARAEVLWGISPGPGTGRGALQRAAQSPDVANSEGGAHRHISWPDTTAMVRVAERGRCLRGPVLDLEEAQAHEHNTVRRTYLKIDGVTQPAPAPRFSRTPANIQGPPPARGADTQEALPRVGLMESETAALSAGSGGSKT